MRTSVALELVGRDLEPALAGEREALQGAERALDALAARAWCSRV